MFESFHFLFVLLDLNFYQPIFLILKIRQEIQSIMKRIFIIILKILIRLATQSYTHIYIFVDAENHSCQHFVLILYFILI